MRPPIPPVPILNWDQDRELLQAARSTRRPGLRLHQPGETVVVLGRGSRPGDELNLDACREDGVSLYRRPGGGCSVVLDPGCLVLSLAYPIQGIGGHRGEFARITDWLLEGLGRCGLSGLRQEDVSDLALGDRKVGGASLYRPRNLLHYTVSLLVEPPVDGMERYLRHPPREPGYRRGRPHRNFVGSLGEAGWTGGAVELASRLEQVLPAMDEALRREETH